MSNVFAANYHDGRGEYDDTWIKFEEIQIGDVNRAKRGDTVILVDTHSGEWLFSTITDVNPYNMTIRMKLEDRYEDEEEIR